MALNKLKSIFKKDKYKVKVERLDTTNDKDQNRSITKLMNLLNYTKKSEVSYSAGDFDAGYHGFEIDGHTFKGQRNPMLRFKDLPFSFDGLSVLDVGCNQGGMLYSIADKIKFGVGVDYDSRMINVANKIKSHKKNSHLDYYVFNLESEDLNYIHDFLPEDNVDVVLLLSVCMWISNWKELITFLETIAEKMVFESNGSPEQQDEQKKYLKTVYKNVQLIHDKSDDDPSQKLRKLYFCYN